MSAIPVSSPKPILPFLTPITDALKPFAEPMVRAATGLLLVPHGAQKLFGWFGGYGLSATGQFFASNVRGGGRYSLDGILGQEF